MLSRESPFPASSKMQYKHAKTTDIGMRSWQAHTGRGGGRPTKLCSNGGLEASESLRAQAERHAGWNVLRIGAEDNHQGIV